MDEPAAEERSASREQIRPSGPHPSPSEPPQGATGGSSRAWHHAPDSCHPQSQPGWGCPVSVLMTRVPQLLTGCRGCVSPLLRLDMDKPGTEMPFKKKNKKNTDASHLSSTDLSYTGTSFLIQSQPEPLKLLTFQKSRKRVNTAIGCSSY